MLKTSVGQSILENGHDAGLEVAKMAMKGLRNAKVGMLYTSCVYNQEEVLAGAKEKMGDIPIIGCTSSGAIMTPDGIFDNETGFAGMMVFDDKDLQVGVAICNKRGDARKLGQKLAMDAIVNSGTNQIPNYFYMVASPKEEESYLKGIQDVIGRVPFFGGSAADNTVNGDWKIFLNDTVVSDGCAVLFFYTDKLMGTEYTGAYRETGEAGIITKVTDKRTMVEIDGIPALKYLAKWYDVKPKDLMGQNLLVRAILNPIGIKNPTGDFIVIRHPMIGNEDLSANVGNDLAPGTAIMLMEATVDELIASTKKALVACRNKIDTDPAGYFLVHCGGRKLGIGDKMGEVYRGVKTAAKGVPFLMLFTFGEYGYEEHSANTCGGLMLSFTSISTK